MELQFVGAVGTVTGSQLLVTQGDTRVLVDCGLFQGVKAVRERNWQRPPYNPADIDAVVLTHAHIDHSGQLPLLVRNGFKGAVYLTEATRDLCNILLPDSGRLQEEAAGYANRRRFSKHHPALPLYTEVDAKAVSKRFRVIETDVPHSVGELELTLAPAGHILGAAGVVLRGGGTSVHVSGDIGRDNDPLMRPPRSPVDVDWVVMESTYGDRVHSTVDPVDALATIVRRTVARGGVLLIPAFAVGRTQGVLHALQEAFDRKLAPKTAVFVNSPMATDVTDLYLHHHRFHRLSEAETRRLHRGVTFVRSVEASKQLNERSGPMIIVSASGMLTGGRVLHHLKAFGPDARNTILLTGYQAPGTRGGSLLTGATEIRLHGDYVPIRAEVAQLHGFSAHADQPGLLAWLRGASRPPRGVFLIHGEAAAADTLRQRIQTDLALDARVPEYLQQVDLSADPVA